MNEPIQNVDKPYLRINFPIEVDISTSANVKTLNIGEGLTTSVFVRKPIIKFPDKCVYCGTPSDTSHEVFILKGKTQKVGSSNRFVNVLVEFKDKFSVPFCQDHLSIFKKNRILNIIGLVLGFILFAPVGYFFSPWKLPDKLGGLLIAGIAGVIGSLLFAWVFRKILALVSKKFKTLKHWPWFTIVVDDGIEHLSFNFQNKEFKQEFIQLNQAENPTFE